jgi:hypothetical protein
MAPPRRRHPSPAARSSCVVSPSKPREESTPFHRVFEELLPLLREEEADRLLNRCPLDGEADDAVPPLIVALLAGTGIIMRFLQRLEGLDNCLLLCRLLLWVWPIVGPVEAILVLRFRHRHFRLPGCQICGCRLVPQLLLQLLPPLPMIEILPPQPLLLLLHMPPLVQFILTPPLLHLLPMS